MAPGRASRTGERTTVFPGGTDTDTRVVINICEHMALSVVHTPRMLECEKGSWGAPISCDSVSIHSQTAEETNYCPWIFWRLTLQTRRCSSF